MTTTRLKNLDHCTHCGAELTAATILDADARPRPGDVTVCIGCGHVYEFDERLLIIELSEAKRRTIQNDPDVRRKIRELQMGIAMLHASRKAGGDT